ncbi:DUF2147 domain-containing protein [Mesoflavibacter zeaxanthinifaciens]|uniref:DUF2147 domain-containing protein n=1 Tax=Mesoflavibacter zeaxanthinifaciens TaxID=393060 RepID=UPI0026F113B0|nr:DUF2147 domain-containing protein [Mesoflavibacter zeaxanthinifaciens]
MIRYITLLLLFFSLSMSAQDIFGEWQTINNKGEEKSIVKIYEENGVVYGKIVKINDQSKVNALCTKCEGDDNNKPILGLIIIKDAVKDGKYYEGGTILDPQNGNTYKLRLAINDKGQLQVRGYLGFIYSTQYWEKVK